MFVIVRALLPFLGEDWRGLVLVVLAGVLIYMGGAFVAAPALVSQIRTNLLAGMRSPRVTEDE